MSFDEKNTWLYALLALATYAAYAAVVLDRAREVPLVEVPYVGPMLGSIGAATLGAIVGAIVIAISAPREADQRDERDVVISRYGDVCGHWVLATGTAGALLLTMVGVAHFWIANALYLAFVSSALIGSAVKLLAYRRGFRPW
jgi:hypothetical protein